MLGCRPGRPGPQRALVVAAHPDDEVLGPGGTVRRLTEQGTEVLTVITCRGRPKMEAAMQQAAGQAQEVLGVTETLFLDLPNLRAEAQPLVTISSRLEALLADFEPELVLTHHYGDLNQDHRVIFEAVMVAARPLPERRVEQLVCFETPSSTEWREGGSHRGFAPNLFVNIGPSLPAKLAALGCYAAEMREYPHPRSVEGVEALARYRGMQAGVAHAEGFHLVRGIIP